MRSNKIVVLGTGGTIAGTGVTGAAGAYLAAQRPVADLLAGLPVPVGCELLWEQVAQIDSKDMGLAVWQPLVRRLQHWLGQAEVRGVVITHGTDTVEETAYLVHRVLAVDKPVVLTCAMRPATALDADGPRNLVDALEVAACPQARGVTLVCSGHIHDPRAVQKVHTWRLDAFSSGDRGPIGQIRHGRIECFRDWPTQSPAAGLVRDALLAAKDLPRVEIILSHAHACGATVRALLDAELAQRWQAAPVRGLVLAGTGGGTIHHELELVLRQAQAQGVRVLRTSRCPDGGLLAHSSDEFPVAEALSPVKARLMLMLDLLGNATPAP